MKQLEGIIFGETVKQNKYGEMLEVHVFEILNT